MGGGYPSAEVQSVYSTAQADWAIVFNEAQSLKWEAKRHFLKTKTSTEKKKKKKPQLYCCTIA